MIKTTESIRPTPSAALSLAGESKLAGRLLHGTVAVYLVLAVAVLVVATVVARTWLALPFPGVLYNRALVFTEAIPVDDPGSWALRIQGVAPGERLVAIDGVPVRDADEAAAALRAAADRASTTFTVRGRDGIDRSVAVHLGGFSLANQAAYLFIPLILAMVLLALAAYVFATRWDSSPGPVVVVLLVSLGLVAICFFDQFTTHVLSPGWLGGLALAAATTWHLAATYPTESSLARRLPILRWLGYLAAVIALAIAAPNLARSAPGTGSLSSWQPTYALAALSVLVFLIVNAVHSINAESPVERAQARLMVASTVMAFGPLLVWSALSSPGRPGFSAYFLFPIALFPLALTYSVLRFRVAGTALWMRQAAIYGLLSLLILAAYALLVTGLSVVFRMAVPATNPLWVAGLAFVLAVLLEPVRTRLQGAVDRTFFRGSNPRTGKTRGLADALEDAGSLAAIASGVRQALELSVEPQAVHIFVRDEPNDQFIAVRDSTNRPSTDIRFASRGSLAEHMAQTAGPVYLDEQALPTNLRADRGRLALLGSGLFLPLRSGGQLVGWIALGPRRSGGQYSPNDLALLEQLAEQASVAIGRVQTVDNLERRIRDMNALTRVAQGVNITLTFDDVLELIYAQTVQILPMSHFYITLYSPEGDYYYLGFAVENNERMPARENRALPSNTGLSREVSRRGRPMIAPDYGRECKALGAVPEAGDISGWMGVPLNAGAESIGALSIGSREHGVPYTHAQLDLLQAVADQTAGAIVKARLLRETQQRAAQLGKLNELTRQLASTLEMDTLRQMVVDGAASIMDCEAGIFYMADQPTGELIVRAASGSLAADILGQHVPAGVTNATRAAASRGPSVENDLVPDAGGHLLGHGIPGFTPRSSLAVPLQVQDSLLGILEVLNRRDGGPFVSEDQSLLMAFGGQAAAALENVRLYTLTDQELAARVEELSVMQRIDRELNASLEMDRAMRITLEWALRQSNAEAGLIGLLDNSRLRIVAELGYGSAVADSTDQTLALTLPGFQPAVETALPQRVRFDTETTGGFLAGADHQLVIPIRREANVIGLLVLESTQPVQEDLGFLSRLSDHAAIAISNAQLYEEVQRANIAKSDFVSLVAHELKNPMTSIKGYTELLAAGAVGAVNEMQANFLNTIRSNTDRMSTLVSDLNDNSKIEAGRLRLDFKAVELQELIDEIIRSASRQIDEKKQVVRLELPDQLPNVWADRTRLGQVFTNLVSNANKYTPEGGSLVIGAEPSPNHWDPEGAGQIVHIWVRDSGIGISAEDQERVFQKFFRSEDPKAREAPGAGLGLNITRSLVEMQGGRIWFESLYRQGTTFHFTVPVAEA